MADPIFSTIGSLKGFDIAYDSSRKHEVGVIDSSLLPTDTLLYRYYFSLEPHNPVDNSFGSQFDTSFGNIGLGFFTPARFSSLVPEVLISRDFIKFVLDFVISEPRFNVQFTPEIADATVGPQPLPYLELREHVLKVAYVFEVKLDANGAIEFLVNKDGTDYKVVTTTPDPTASPPEINLPVIPTPDERGKAWFDFYEEFDSGGSYAEFNRFTGKAPSDDFNFTYENPNSAQTTDTKRIGIEGLTEGKHYLISYEGISSHLYRQMVEVKFVKFNIVQGGVSLNGFDPPFVERRIFHHYLYKEWTDSAGNAHEGWRLSEQWHGDVPVHLLQSSNKEFDNDPASPTFNPIIGKKTGAVSNWGVFNMSNDNLNKRDDERVGYDRKYALFLNDRAKTSTNTSSTADTNELFIPAGAPLSDLDAKLTQDNFKIEFVSKNVVNYTGNSSSGDTVIEIGGPIGVGIGTFGTSGVRSANTLNYSGFWESQLYKRSYPRNTRIVNVFNRATNGAVGTIIAVRANKTGTPRSAVADPVLAFALDRNLYYKIFDDNSHKSEMGVIAQQSRSDRAFRFTSNPLLGEPINTFPGQNAIIEKFGYKTFIDDGKLTSSTSPKSGGGSSSSVVLELSDSTADVDTATATVTAPATNTDAVWGAVNTIGVNVPDTGLLLTALKIKMVFTISTTDLALNSNPVYQVKIRGWESKPVVLGGFIDRNDEKPARELSLVSLTHDKEVIVDIVGWTGLEFIEIITKQAITSATASLVSLKEEFTGTHVIKDIISLACNHDRSGNAMIFYTTTDNRLNLLHSSNSGIDWSNIENIMIRGDAVEDIRSVSDEVERDFAVFYFYKDALLVTYFNKNIFNVLDEDYISGTDQEKKDKRARAFDSVRRQTSNLVWGDVIKLDSEKATQTNAAGEVVFQDIEDNVLYQKVVDASGVIDTTDYDAYVARTSPVVDIIKEDLTDTTSSAHQLNGSNKFIQVSEATASSTFNTAANPTLDNSIHLAKSNPNSRDYSAYVDRKGVTRLMIRNTNDDGQANYRCLASDDGGKTWEDGWRFQADVANNLDPVRINSLSSGASTEEGTDIQLLYNNKTYELYVFYFYLDCILCKVIPSNVFSKSDDEKSEIINNLNIYAVCGNLTNLDSEKKVTIGDSKKIIFGEFQNDNFDKYYSRADYEPQAVAGYITKHSFPRIFVIRGDNSVDAFFFDGNQWYPEQVYNDEEIN
jgi:hypothetical protein